ncbi:Acryloyl-CoA reductase (NADH) [Methylacidimicrobium cyclopophantes]|uniref:Acryloyl-CoA reductase (NADH) n=1 Tax=Methylacidimicrobium cyclopophantes TaxID=1041766 RepID=A0A5E6M8K1_9BACT|nr:acyl-CoA dehydrogenase family protein [Methylacidimicrobium cyclopophantes]VVM05257.1 Acryloyl-CoA reductase (NADH) [Methylacidimicrobium cyclopophantes]
MRATSLEKEIAPAAARHDREERFPAEMYRKALSLGLLNLFVPGEYGDSGLGPVEEAIICEELGWA